MSSNTKEKIKIELNEKEIYVLWSIMCWFDSPLISSTLKYKFADALRNIWGTKWLSGKRRDILEKRHDKAILQRIAEIGEWANSRHSELIK